MAETPSTTYELIALLGTAWSILIEGLHKELAARGFEDVRPSHGFVFQRLAPYGATGNELAEHLGVTKQAASQMIDYLEERGYVVRKPHPSDKRGKLVLLTQRGWDCIRATEAVFARIEQRWTAIVGPDHMTMLRADLRCLVASSESDIVSYRLRPPW
jgi:DNA-binding MarR family transcriptional regulator